MTRDLLYEPRELELLASACRLRDKATQLEEAVGTDVVVTGSKGQVRVHPAVAEARQAALAVAHLLGKLAIPTADERPMTDKQRQASRAARARWDRAKAG
jgi:hypothetical protein